MESERLAAAPDVETQSRWRATRAKLLARRSELDEAERLAREAVELVAEAEFPSLQGHALTALADVLRLTGRPAEAAPLLTSALELHERKGNIVSAAEIRRMLEQVGALDGSATRRIV
jgi:ATP/maltotriose-dependent transcriptional regulator MalT